MSKKSPATQVFTEDGGGFTATPWAQIEFSIENSVIAGPFEQGIFRYFPANTQALFEKIMLAEAAKPESFKYDQNFSREWEWKAELVLNASEPFRRHEDYSTIYSVMGGWWERSSSACTPWVNSLCDQKFSIFKIHKNSTVYNPTLYESADISYMAFIDKKGGAYSMGEVLAPIKPDDVSGTMTIKWRRWASTTYQGIAYRLNPLEKKLRIRWGSVANTLAGVILPTVPSNSDACDGETTTCMGHDGYWGGSGGG